jgi:hypothetical protein
MTEEELKTFRHIIVTGVGAASVIIMLVAILRPEPEVRTKFEVVDQYQGCEVVRYTDPSDSWHYFLNCSKD